MTKLLARMQNFEKLSTRIYQIQTPAFNQKQIAGRLKAAMLKELEHENKLRKRLTELGGVPSRLGSLFDMTGRLTGYLTRLTGKSFILKADIWVEEQAIKGYRRSLTEADFDYRSRIIINNNIRDEEIHIYELRKSLAEITV